MANLEDLNEDDAYHFVFWVNNVMRRYDNVYYQHRMGLVDRNRWEMHRTDIALLLRAPGIATWWHEHRPNFSPEFVTLVSEILGEESGQADDSR